MEQMKKLIIKYREIIIYLIVGVMTTIVSWAACFLLKYLGMNPDISWQNFVINSFGWIVGVTFAYPLNRQWVFRSKNPHIMKEFGGFAASRLSTWILDIVVMWGTVNAMNMHYWIAKIFISSVLVTVINYVFSKLFIFKKKGSEG